MQDEGTLLQLIEDNEQDFTLYYDLNLKVLSQQNLVTLQNHIKKGMPGQPPLQEEQLNSGLSVQEVRFVQYILENSQFTHNTLYLEDIKTNNNTMKSLQERVAAGEQTNNRNTASGSKADGFIYFTFGQTVPKFLSSKAQDKISFNPNALQNKNKTVYQHGFVSWYPLAGIQRRTTPIYFLGNCQFHYTHVSDTEKHYIYQFEGQKPIRWVVTAQQEIFYGEDILKGLAYQMILHLRFIGGSYRTHVLNNFREVNVLSAFQDMIYPVDYYPEFKLPVQFTIAETGITITEAKSITTAPSSFIDKFKIDLHQALMAGNYTVPFLDEKMELYENPGAAKTDYQKQILLIASVEKGDLQQIEAILSNNKFDLNEEYPTGTILNIAITHIRESELRLRVVQLLIDHGADPNHSHKEDGKNSFYYAIEQKDKSLFTYLLSIKRPHSLDAQIQIGPKLNHDKDQKDKAILDLICEHNLIDWLALAIAYGANIHQFPSTIYASAANAGHVEMVTALIACGVSLNAVAINAKTPLMIFASNGNEAGVNLLLQHNVDVHHRSYIEGEYVNALDFALRSQTKNENIIRLLQEKGAVETSLPPAKNQKKAVVIIVTADTENNERYVLLGQKRNEDNSIVDEYCFPGGLVDLFDQDCFVTAERELQEETNLKLNGEALKGKYSQHTLFTFSEVYQDMHYYIEFIHFHLFADPSTLRIKADDDLGAVYWLPLKSVYVGYDKYERKRFLLKEGQTYTPIQQSNGLVLESLFRTSLDKDMMQKALRIDNFGIHLLMDATRCDDAAQIEDLIYDRTKHFISFGDLGTPLNLAAACGSIKAVKFYLDFDPNLLQSPIHPAVSAATNNHWEIFDLLYAGNLDSSSEGMILMHCITTQNLSKTVFCLQHFKMDVNKRLDDEQFFISRAAQTGNIKLVKLLIHFGAHVNPSFIGLDKNVTKVFSPLHAAIYNHKQEMAIFLIQQGADINCRDNITTQTLVSFSYQSLLRTTWAINNNQMLQNSRSKNNPMDYYIPFDNSNCNAIMKALQNDCGQVIAYILDNDFWIDTQQLDFKQLNHYADKYPALLALFDENNHTSRHHTKLLT